MKSDAGKRGATPAQSKTTLVKELKPGTSAYMAVHYWVAKQWGKPSNCEHCDEPNSKRFEWANLSGKYLKERSDWARLCASCHRRYDTRGTHCPHGHEYTPENSYIPSTKPNQRTCIRCNRIAVRAYKLKKKELTATESPLKPVKEDI